MATDLVAISFIHAVIEYANWKLLMREGGIN